MFEVTETRIVTEQIIEGIRHAVCGLSERSGIVDAVFDALAVAGVEPEQVSLEEWKPILVHAFRAARREEPVAVC